MRGSVFIDVTDFCPNKKLCTQTDQWRQTVFRENQWTSLLTDICALVWFVRLFPEGLFQAASSEKVDTQMPFGVGLQTHLLPSLLCGVCGVWKAGDYGLSSSQNQVTKFSLSKWRAEVTSWSQLEQNKTEKEEEEEKALTYVTGIFSNLERRDWTSLADGTNRIKPTALREQPHAATSPERQKAAHSFLWSTVGEGRCMYRRQAQTP